MTITKKLQEIALEFNLPTNKVGEQYLSFYRQCKLKDIDYLPDKEFDNEILIMTKRYYEILSNPRSLGDEIIDGWYKELR